MRAEEARGQTQQVEAERAVRVRVDRDQAVPAPEKFRLSDREQPTRATENVSRVFPRRRLDAIAQPAATRHAARIDDVPRPDPVGTRDQLDTSRPPLAASWSASGGPRGSTTPQQTYDVGGG